MWEDPIVAEVHRTREKFAAECNYDLVAYFADVRKRQASLGSRLVRQRGPADLAAAAEQGRNSGIAGSAASETAPAA